VDRLGPYEVLGEIARGGMGVVYRARDPRLDRLVAIKVLLRARGQGSKVRKRFEREAEALARIRHPHVVAVHDSGQDRGTPYLVLDLVEGESLRRRLRRAGPLPPAEAATVAAKVARALQHAHDQGVLHRDVKPDNVLLDADGEPRLTDFGLARWLEPDERTQVSVSGVVMGTPGYLPPEQARGQRDRIDARSDVFGAGALLYALLSGEPPFPASTVFEVLSVLERPAADVRTLRPEVPGALADVVSRALALERDDRYPTAGALADALEGWNAAPARASPRRRAALTGGLVLGAVSLGVAIALASRARDPQTPPAEALDDATPAADVPDPAAQVNAALKQGLHATLLAHADSHDPAVVARVAAWVDDRPALGAALARLPAAQARVWAWRLRRFVPDVDAPAGPLVASEHDAWDAVASGEECLARGLIGPAALAFAQAERLSGSEVAPRRAARLGLLRVARARGDDAAAQAQITRLKDDDPDALTLVGLLATAATLEGSPFGELASVFGGHPAVVLARHRERWRDGERPEAASLTTLPWLVRLREAVRLGDHRARDALLARVTLQGRRGSWVRSERELCRRGFDGPLGLRLAAAVDLAHAAYEGQDPVAASQAEASLLAVGTERPTSPLLWYALAQVAVTRGERQSAIEHVGRAAAVSPRDPQVLLLAAWIERALETGPSPDPTARSERVRASYRALLPTLPADDPLTARARLGAASVSAVIREATLDDPERAARALAAMEEDLTPLLEPFDAAFHAARERLEAADDRGDPQALAESAAELLRGLPADPWRLRPLASALGLRARGGGAAGARAGRAFQCLLGDLPARAVVGWRVSEQQADHDRRRAGLDAALTLWPGSPDLLYAKHTLPLWPSATRPFAATPTDYRDLARVAARSPRRAAAVADLLLHTGEVPDRARLDAAVRDSDPGSDRAEALLARALWHLRRGAVSRHAEASLDALRDAQEAITLLPECWGARLVAARALERARDPRAAHGDAPSEVHPELLAILRPVEVAAPWLTAPLSIRLAYTRDWEARAALADRLLAQGYLIRPEPVLPSAATADPSSATATRLQQLRDWLLESSLPDRRLRERSTLRLLDDTFAGLREPNGRPVLPHTTCALQLSSRSGPPPHEGLLPGLPEHVRPVAAALIAQNVGGPDSGWGDASDLARRLLRSPRGTQSAALRPEQLWPQGLLVWPRDPLRERVETLTIGPDPVLAEASRRLYLPRGALLYAATTPLAVSPPYDLETLGGPGDRGAAHLANLHATQLQQRACGTLARLRAWGEARRAIVRAGAFAAREDFDEVLAEEGVDEVLHRAHLVQDGVAFGQQLQRLAEVGLSLPSLAPGRRLALRTMALAGTLWGAAADESTRGDLLTAAQEHATALAPLLPAPAEAVEHVKVEAAWFLLVLAVARGEADAGALAAGVDALRGHLAACDEVQTINAKRVLRASPFRDATLTALGELGAGLLGE
jgi:hypothetical protein